MIAPLFPRWERVLSRFTPGALAVNHVVSRAKGRGVKRSGWRGAPNHATLPFYQHRTITELEMLPIIVEKKTGKILGCYVICPLRPSSSREPQETWKSGATK